MLDKLLKSKGLTWEELSADEVATLNAWLGIIQNGQLTLTKVKEYITSLKVTVEQELITKDMDSRDDIFLKARLRNLMLLEAFMSSADKAKEQLEASLSNLAAKKEVG